jgi:hypothetical protein
MKPCKRAPRRQASKKLLQSGVAFYFRLNPGDHPDHYMTGQAALAATEGLSAHRVHYVGYGSAKSPENLSAKDRDMKCAVYAVTGASLLALDHPISWRHYDESYAGRSYFRRL